MKLCKHASALAISLCQNYNYHMKIKENKYSGEKKVSMYCEKKNQKRGTVSVTKVVTSFVSLALFLKHKNFQ